MDDEQLEDAQATAVAECIGYVDQILERYPKAIVLKEEYLPVDDETLLDGTKHTTAGYADWACVSSDGKTGEIVDYKYGARKVTDAEFNLQGIAYMLGLKKKFPTLETCTVSFFQPHIEHDTKHTFDLRNPESLYLQIRTVVARAVEAALRPDDFSSAVANSSSCLFCGLIGRCPKVAELAISIGKKYAPLKVPENVVPSLVSDPTDASIGIQLAQVLEVWCGAFRAQVTAKSIENIDWIPAGYKLVSATRRILKHGRKLGELAKTFLPEKERPAVDELYDIPIGKVEKLISKFAPRGSKEKTVEEFGKKALAEGILEEGQPYAFLRQDDK